MIKFNPLAGIFEFGSSKKPKIFTGGGTTGPIQHFHANQDILDSTTASFTTALKLLYDTNYLITLNHVNNTNNPHNGSLQQFATMDPTIDLDLALALGYESASIDNLLKKDFREGIRGQDRTTALTRKDIREFDGYFHYIKEFIDSNRLDPDPSPQTIPFEYPVTDELSSSIRLKYKMVIRKQSFDGTYVCEGWATYYVDSGGSLAIQNTYIDYEYDGIGSVYTVTPIVTGSGAIGFDVLNNNEEMRYFLCAEIMTLSETEDI